MQCLINRLREYADWADAHEYEVSLCLADDLRKAADYIETMEERMADDGK